ncbi:hypothetical protein MMC06_004493 [Schaereria dolodes]|nr:hypothetical protein [Schaereria dolodes]
MPSEPSLNSWGKPISIVPDIENASRKDPYYICCIRLQFPNEDKVPWSLVEKFMWWKFAKAHENNQFASDYKAIFEKLKSENHDTYTRLKTHFDGTSMLWSQTVGIVLDDWNNFVKESEKVLEANNGKKAAESKESAS